MRLKWVKTIVVVGLALAGSGLLFVSTFAYRLHLDTNPGWGPNRIAIAAIGGASILLSAVVYASPLLSRLSKLPAFQRMIRRLRAPLLWLFGPTEGESTESRPARGTAWFATAGALIAIFFTFWYITSGRMVTFTPATAYFDRQANAFLAGQLSLLEKPPAALATIPDPYQVKNRGALGYIWDASYYKGKYYYYWGPVPALMIAAVKLFRPSLVVQDQALIVFSVSGLGIVLAALFHRLKKNYFPKLPAWTVLGFVLLGVLNTPLFWLVNHPVVHEAPIAVGQFFLILGLYTALRGMEAQKGGYIWLAGTGLIWGASIASRIDLGPGIFWMVALVSLFILLKAGKLQRAVGPILAIGLPLLAWGAGLAWYNYARFGNILETGHRYQLTGGAMPADYRNIASISYILPNLYNLLFRPFQILWREFPFFFTPYLTSHSWPKLFFFPHNPNYFFDEPIAGLFICIPAIWILLAVLVIPLQNSLKGPAGHTDAAWSLRNQSLTGWLTWMAGGALLLNLASLSIFIYTTMRYLADVTPLLAILIFLCLGWVSTRLSSRSRIWKVVLVMAGILMLMTVSICLLTNFQNGDWIFKNNNPQLYRVIEHFFTDR